MEAGNGELVFSLPNKTRNRLWYYELLMLNIRVKLKGGTKRVIVPKYTVNSIPVGFKAHIKKQICSVELS